ncbi:MAG: hypothetical protein ACU836_16720 [Gammaproteobacteria bacterium]
MRNLALLALIAGGMASAAPSVSFAKDKASREHKEAHGHHHKPLKVALWGDEFYSDDPNEKSIMVEQTIRSMNEHHLDFTMFAGDTKSGSTWCTDQAIGQDVVEIFDSLKAPTLYTLGDNEWTDCHRTNNGSFDPLERLSFLRATFFDKDTTQGKQPIKVERQGELGGAYSENSRFTKHNVEFVALHVVGSNNNQVVTDKQCTSKSDRTQAACDAATLEYQMRNQKNVEWLKDSFAKAREEQNAGIAIIIQADIYFPFEMSDGGYDDFLAGLNADNGYTDFFNTLADETKNFAGQVVLIHGDSHYYKVDKAMFNDDGRLTPNFTRVEVFGSKENSWVEMTVDPTSEQVFSFVPVVLSH